MFEELQRLIVSLMENKVFVKTVKDSNLISTWAYNKESKTLTILFKKGALYKYNNVGMDIAFRLLLASSVGKEFHNFISNNYSYTKIESGC